MGASHLPFSNNQQWSPCSTAKEKTSVRTFRSIHTGGKIHLICPTLNTRNTNTTMRHTALLLGAFALSTVFCRKKKKRSTSCWIKNYKSRVPLKYEWAPLWKLLWKRGVCGFIGRALTLSLSPHSADPPVVSWGCRSHTSAPRSQTRPLSDEPPVRAGTPSSSSERGTPTRGSLSCAAAAGRSSTRVR